MTLKVLSFNKVTSRAVSYELSDILKLNDGDEILFVLKNGFVHVRKFDNDKVQLEQGEKYISISTVRIHDDKRIEIYMPDDIRKLIGIEKDDNILWLIDNYKNVILRNTLLLDKCSKELFNKNSAALIIGMTILTYPPGKITIPLDIIEILGVYEGDKIILSVEPNYNNIIVSKEPTQNIAIQYATIYCESTRYNWSIFLSRSTTDYLNMNAGNKILWIVDENANVFMKPAILPDICL